MCRLLKYGLVALVILSGSARANTSIGGWGTFHDVAREISDPSRITALFQQWDFRINGLVAELKWQGTLLDRKHSSILLKDNIGNAPNVTILICGGGSTTVDGCKASIGHFRDTKSDMIATYAPNVIWLKRRQHVDKTARQILDDIRSVLAKNPDATFNFHSASLGYPVFAALFGENGRYSDEMRHLMTIQGQPEASRLKSLVVTTPARGFWYIFSLRRLRDGLIGFWEGPKELFLTGVFGKALLTVIHDGERFAYLSPQIYTEGIATYVYPQSLSDPKVKHKATETTPEITEQKVSDSHRLVHRGGNEWQGPAAIKAANQYGSTEQASAQIMTAMRTSENVFRAMAAVQGLNPPKFGIYQVKNSAALRKSAGKLLHEEQFNDAQELGGVRLSTPGMTRIPGDLSDFAADIKGSVTR
ncbi:hypothetical protein ACOTTU_12850 [Roseobacter sp. EG26]|uniref:hypothetical protein n=1 Tax=Roseobacter sp. EG26 TaxID=3412477 RepID=UPI003CE556F6